MDEAHYGFIYIGQTLADKLAYQAAQTVTLALYEAPYLVHYDTATLAINEWSGQLWFVEVLDNLPTKQPKDELQAIPSRHFKLIKQLTNSFLFGSRGEGICLLLDRILTLDLAEVQQLANLFSPLGAEAYAVAWNNWLVNFNNLAEHRDTDHTGTLAIGSGEQASPIYSGFLVINEMLYQKANELEGANAFVSYPPYTEQPLLNPLWNKACSVLLQAAMALGAEQYVAPNDLKVLLAGWRLLTND